MAILTKEEFREFYGYNSLPAVHRLLREKIIIADKNGKIDTENEKNSAFCKARLEKIRNQKPKEEKTTTKTTTTKGGKNQKSADQLALEIDLLNARLEEKNQSAELKRIQIAKQKREVIETDVLNRCIQEIFGDMIKRLTELPNIYAVDVIKTVQSEENPKELIVEFLTQKISNTLKQGLQAAKTAAKKYYEGGEDVE